METSTNNEIVDILLIANISKPNNFDVLSANEWKWLVKEVKKDFGNKLTQGELMEIISNGAKGKYNKTQFSINCFVIYKWIEKFLEDKAKKSVREIKSADVFGDV